jgi:hypothetical protein
MPSGGCSNTEYFLTHIIDPLLAKVFPERRKNYALRLSVHLDNCRVDSSNASKQLVNGNSLVTVPHPPYSPDFALSNCWLVGHIRTSLAGPVFNDADKLAEAIIGLLNQIQRSELQLIFHHWIERVKLVLANNGDYYHE